MAGLARLTRFLVTIEKLERDPTIGIKRAKKPKREINYLPAEIATRLIRAAGPTVHPHTGKQAGQFNA